MIEALVDALRAEGGTLGELVAAPCPTAATWPRAAAACRLRPAGGRARGRLRAPARDDLRGLAAALRRRPGSSTPSDPDLALLLGDQLYALGLARLAALGDLEAVDALATVISRLAQAHAEGDGASAEEIWAEGARAVGWGSSRARDGRLDVDDSLSPPPQLAPAAA